MEVIHVLHSTGKPLLEQDLRWNTTKLIWIDGCPEYLGCIKGTIAAYLAADPASARFWFFLDYTDRNTLPPLIIGEISVPLLSRQKYLATDHRLDFGPFIMRTEIPRH